MIEVLCFRCLGWLLRTWCYCCNLNQEQTTTKCHVRLSTTLQKASDMNTYAWLIILYSNLIAEISSVWFISDRSIHGPLAKNLNYGLCMHSQCGKRFPHYWVSDSHLHHGTCVTHVPWCILGSLSSGFLWWQENAPGIRGACTVRSFTYLVRGPCSLGLAVLLTNLCLFQIEKYTLRLSYYASCVLNTISATRVPSNF